VGGAAVGIRYRDHLGPKSGRFDIKRKTKKKRVDQRRNQTTTGERRQEEKTDQNAEKKKIAFFRK